MFEFVQLFFQKRHDDTGCGNTKGGLRYDTAHWKLGGIFFSRYMTAVGKEVRYVVFARMGSL